MTRSALALLPFVLLAACGDPAPDADAVAKSETIWCGLDGATELKRDCALERGMDSGRAVFVVHHPDGKFRRLLASNDGQNLLAADGADQSQSALKQDRWEVILGDDRYVVPVRADAARP